MEETTYEITCLITGKTDNLRMYALRNDRAEMIGWIFIHQSITMEEIEAVVHWKYKIQITT